MIIEHLENLGTGKTQPLDRVTGLCDELAVLLGIEDNVLSRLLWRDIKKLMTTWPKASGSFSFPVTTSDMQALDTYITTTDKWGDNEYGNNRRELCRWLAKEMADLGVTNDMTQVQILEKLNA